MTFIKGLKTFCGVLAISAIAIGASSTFSAKAEGITDAQKKDIEAVIENYLMENPEIIFESINKYRDEQRVAEIEQQKEALKTRQDDIISASSPSVGSEKPTVTVVEFFDYNCGYCKKAIDGLARIVKEDKDVKVVFKEFPILSESSEMAARWALAADKQGKYFEYHIALMEFKGPKNEDTLSNLAKKVGLDVAKLKTDAASDAVSEEIRKTRELASELGINGTPAFIIGDQLSPGFVPYEGMKSLIDSAKQASN